MRKLDQRGIAAIPLVVIIAVSTGAALATPVIVDVADVDPDSPFYGLERLGEQIRMVGNEDQMKERWSEYVRLVNRAKGLTYRHILEEFVEKMQEVVPGDADATHEVVQWMQEQMPGIGEVRLRLLKELAQGIKTDLADLPDASGAIENEINEIESYEGGLSTATPAQLENIMARAQVFRERLGSIANQYSHMIQRPVNVYLDLDNTIAEINTTTNIEVNITIVAPPTNLSARFDEKLADFDAGLAEVQTKTGELPEDSYLKTVVEGLINRATAIRNQAVGLKTAYPRRALFLLYKANLLLNQAKAIIEYATEWVPPEWVSGWTQDGTWTENMVAWTGNLPWYSSDETQAYYQLQ